MYNSIYSAWHETLEKLNIRCRYRPSEDKLDEWLHIYSADVIEDGIRRGMKNFCNRAEIREGQELTQYNLKFCFSYLNGVMRNIQAEINASAKDFQEWEQ